MSGNALRRSLHSPSPIRAQPRDLTKSRTRSFLLARGTLIPCDRRLVLHKRFGKTVAAGPVRLRNKIHVPGLGRAQRRLNRTETGVRDRTRRQTGVLIRVPATRAAEIGAMDYPAIA